ncbi:hypothetical protein T439DRAFT_300689 [Meredithblackwellia eburnea MCA 4105]
MPDPHPPPLTPAQLLRPPSRNNTPRSTKSKRSGALRHRGKDGTMWRPDLAFHAGLGAAWAAIAVLWIITPLSWLYVLWTLITLHPALSSARPASHGPLRILHYLVLAYAALEVPFSVYYRFLAWQAQALRQPPQYSRKYLRKIIMNSLENGLHTHLDEDDEHGAEHTHGHDEDEEANDVLEALGLGELTKVTSRESHKGQAGSSNGSVGGFFNMRKRNNAHQQQLLASTSSSWGGIHPANEGSSTPDLSTTDLRIPMQTLSKEGVKGITNGGPGGAAISPSSSQDSMSSSKKSAKEHDEGKVSSSTGGGPLSAAKFFPEPISSDDPRAHDFRQFVSLWFYGAKFEDIGRLNMADWLSWSLYGETYDQLVKERKEWEKKGKPQLHLDGSPDEDEEGLDIDGDKLGLMEHCLDLVEARAGRTMPPGRNSRVKTIRLTLDPVRVMSRPLVLYVFVWCLQSAVIANAKRHGFKEEVDGETRYLVRRPEGWTPDRNCSESNRPLLFLHGLGMGMAQYATLLNYLCVSKTLKNRPIMILLQPNISMSFFSRGYLDPLEQHSTAAGLKRVAQKYQFDKSGLTVLSHSNGTMVHGWLLKASPELCLRNCFVDPVCFCLWEPYVAYNFLYSSPVTPIEYLMRYFVSRELGVAIMLQRSFDWSANLLLPETVPNVESPYHSAFFLAGKDSILNADRVRKYLRRHGVKQVGGDQGIGDAEGGLKLHPDNRHGQSMIGTGEPFDMIMDWVTRDQFEGDVTSGNSSDAV